MFLIMGSAGCVSSAAVIFPFVLSGNRNPNETPERDYGPAPAEDPRKRPRVQGSGPRVVN